VAEYEDDKVVRDPDILEVNDKVTEEEDDKVVRDLDILGVKDKVPVPVPRSSISGNTCLEFLVQCTGVTSFTIETH
jgi:hypothetical protein